LKKPKTNPATANAFTAAAVNKTEGIEMERTMFQNPNLLTRDEALTLYRTESNLQATALPATVTPIDNPSGTCYDRSNVTAAARHMCGLALRDASVIQSK